MEGYWSYEDAKQAIADWEEQKQRTSSGGFGVSMYDDSNSPKFNPEEWKGKGYVPRSDILLNYGRGGFKGGIHLEVSWDDKIDKWIEYVDWDPSTGRSYVKRIIDPKDVPEWDLWKSVDKNVSRGFGGFSFPPDDGGPDSHLMRNMRNPTDWSKAPLELTIKNPPADKKELNDFSLPLGKTDPSNSWITPDPASKGEGKIDLEAFKTGGHPFNPQPGGAEFKPVPPGPGGAESNVEINRMKPIGGDIPIISDPIVDDPMIVYDPIDPIDAGFSPPAPGQINISLAKRWTNPNTGQETETGVGWTPPSGSGWIDGTSNWGRVLPSASGPERGLIFQDFAFWVGSSAGNALGTKGQGTPTVLQNDPYGRPTTISYGDGSNVEINRMKPIDLFPNQPGGGPSGRVDMAIPNDLVRANFVDRPGGLVSLSEFDTTGQYYGSGSNGQITEIKSPVLPSSFGAEKSMSFSSPMKAMSGGVVGFKHKRKKIEQVIKNHKTRKNITG